MWLTKRKSMDLPTPETALPGRTERPFRLTGTHAVLGTPIEGPYPETCERLILGLGCFWGAERLFWQQQGVFTTAVGYAGGITPNPTYDEVCTGRTGHNEVVLVVFEPAEIDLDRLLKLFFESHDPTQGMRQGNDVGTQYRSGIYATTDAQLQRANAAADTYGEALAQASKPALTTEIIAAPPFYFAEEEHQQYLAKNPWGYCGLQGTGVACPIPEKAPAVPAA
jgi:peptide-methionine (S)-S-oxide reductase